MGRPILNREVDNVEEDEEEWMDEEDWKDVLEEEGGRKESEEGEEDRSESSTSVGRVKSEKVGVDGYEDGRRNMFLKEVVGGRLVV